MFVRLVYTSILDRSVTNDQIEELISEAAASNQRLGVTGVIGIEDGRVCQVIEGPYAVIMRLFASIRSDERHSDVTKIAQVDDENRRFPDWTMVRRPMIEIIIDAYSERAVRS